jgi:hypothetical protein
MPAERTTRTSKRDIFRALPVDGGGDGGGGAGGGGMGGGGWGGGGGGALVETTTRPVMNGWGVQW